MGANGHLPLFLFARNSLLIFCTSDQTLNKQSVWLTSCLFCYFGFLFCFWLLIFCLSTQPYSVSSAVFKFNHLRAGSFLLKQLIGRNFTDFPFNSSVDLVESAIKLTLKGGQGPDPNSGES